MSANFIKMISELHTERFNVHFGELVTNRTPCGIFFGFVMTPNNAAANIQMLIKTGLNVSCAIVLADIQANALRNLVDVPVITLEDFPHFGEENSYVKPQEIFIINLKDFAFTSYFARHEMEVITSSNGENFLNAMKHLPELYSVYEMLGGDESKKVFCAAIKGDLTGKISDYRFAPEPQYFLEGFCRAQATLRLTAGLTTVQRLLTSLISARVFMPSK